MGGKYAGVLHADACSGVRIQRAGDIEFRMTGQIDIIFFAVRSIAADQEFTADTDIHLIIKIDSAAIAVFRCIGLNGCFTGDDRWAVDIHIEIYTAAVIFGCIFIDRDSMNGKISCLFNEYPSAAVFGFVLCDFCEA